MFAQLRDGRSVVVRGGVEPPTFRFSGRVRRGIPRSEGAAGLRRWEKKPGRHLFVSTAEVIGPCPGLYGLAENRWTWLVRGTFR